jgi:hypothetical protein
VATKNPLKIIPTASTKFLIYPNTKLLLSFVVISYFTYTNMNFISIVALLVGISSHALAAIPVPTTHVDEDILERQPGLRGFDPDFYEQSFDTKDEVAGAPKKISKTATKVADHLTTAAEYASKLSALAATAATDASDNVGKVAWTAPQNVTRAALKAAYKTQKEVAKANKKAGKLVLGSIDRDEDEDPDEDENEDEFLLSFLDELLAIHDAYDLDLEAEANAWTAVEEAANKTVEVCTTAAAFATDAANTAKRSFINSVATATEAATKAAATATEATLNATQIVMVMGIKWVWGNTLGI